MADQVNIADLKPGMVIIRILAQNGPVKIRKSGLVTSMEMVQGLAEMGVLQLEIDPEQSVEIEPANVTKSQTQKLLDSGLRSNHDLDHSLSEQFNRSLFLPSVQGLPSVWQHYGKQALLVALVVLGGASLGWTAATADHWLTVFSAKPSAEPSQYHQPAADVSSQPLQPAAAQPQAQTQAQAPSTQAVSMPVDPTTVKQTAEPPQMTISSQAPVSSQVPVATPVTVTPKVAVESAISPELLAKFNAAIEELDAQPQPEYRNDIKVHGDIPRVDQLPTRTMTRLPNMSFSAHMYATNPQERWVRVNGQRLMEGDWISDQLRLEAIAPQHVILSFEGEQFKMAALTDW